MPTPPPARTERGTFGRALCDFLASASASLRHVTLRVTKQSFPFTPDENVLRL
ncbi:MAG TPA: hypothetical protein VHA78_02865 [Candidatus Peribacteraceae bacterium]|nr:hypothetical protein [Candidatus Peribacteraceae bacterium]